MTNPSKVWEYAVQKSNFADSRDIRTADDIRKLFETTDYNLVKEGKQPMFFGNKKLQSKVQEYGMQKRFHVSPRHENVEGKLFYMRWEVEEKKEAYEKSLKAYERLKRKKQHKK